MKVSYNWLRDYVDTKLDPERLAYLLTMAGVNVASCEKIGSDYVFELEITANRPDCLSVLGIAREAAAILGKSLKMPEELRKTRTAGSKTKEKLPLDIKVKNPELCPRYTARVIRDVEVGPSPDWLKDKIISVGLRPVNNIVDITNFVLFETGQPMHAFDLDRIKGDISVRRAAREERIMAIDNTPRVLSQDMLVIADESGPIAIGGVMGGLDTEVNDMTKNILLESAFFDPVSVRRTSRALGLSSESSYRFERRIDNDMVMRASERASRLMENLAGGTAIGNIIDIGKKSPYSKTINYDLKKANEMLGVPIGKGEATKILKALGFSVKDKKSSMAITVPSFREDVKSDVDLSEEIARIYGYDRIPFTVPRVVGNATIKDSASLLEGAIASRLTRLGLNEIITYSLINRDSVRALGIDESDIVAIKNPLSIDQEIMRPTLLAGMLGAVSYNFNRKAKGLSLFEIGKIYEEKGNAYDEAPTLSVGLAGVKREDWKSKSEDFDFFDIKGIFEKLLGELGLSEVLFKKAEKEGLHRDMTSVVEHNGEVIAYIGEVARETCENFGIEKRVFYGELDIEKIKDAARLQKRYMPFSRYPSVSRDISMILNEDLTLHEITSLIREEGGELVRDISLVDCYRGKQIPQGKRGLLLRIEYRSSEKTLEDKEVDELHNEIKGALSGKLAVSFR